MVPMRYCWAAITSRRSITGLAVMAAAGGLAVLAALALVICYAKGKKSESRNQGLEGDGKDAFDPDDDTITAEYKDRDSANVDNGKTSRFHV
jgi:hypothetical protein